MSPELAFKLTFHLLANLDQVFYVVYLMDSPMLKGWVHLHFGHVPGDKHRRDVGMGI